MRRLPDGCTPFSALVRTSRFRVPRSSGRVSIRSGRPGYLCSTAHRRYAHVQGHFLRFLCLLTDGGPMRLAAALIAALFVTPVCAKLPPPTEENKAKAAEAAAKTAWSDKVDL